MRHAAALLLLPLLVACDRDLALPDAPPGGETDSLAITAAELCSGHAPAAPGAVTACIPAIGASGLFRASVTVSQAATDCSLTAGGTELPCTAVGATQLEWSCEGTIPGPIADGTLHAELVARRGELTARLGLDVEADTTPPVLQLAGSSLERTLDPALAAELLVDASCVEGSEAAAGDRLQLAEGALSDPGATYAGAGVVALQLRGEGPRCARSWELALGPAGEPVPLPGTEAASPQRLFVRAVDAVGNVSAELELLSAADVDGPVIDPAAITVGWQAGLALVSLPTSALADASPVATVALLPGGGPLAIGQALQLNLSASTATEEHSLVAVDKCGNAAAPLALPGTRDTTAPVLDRSLLLVSRTSAGVSLDGAAGFANDLEQGPLTIRLLDSAGALLATTGAASGGPLAPVPLAQDLSIDELAALVIELEDLGGNVASGRPGRGRFELSAAGRQPYDPGSAPVQLVPFAADVDPRQSSPGLAYASAPEPLDGGAWAIDAQRLEVLAEPAEGPASDALSPLSPGPRVGARFAYAALVNSPILFGGSTDSTTWRWGAQGFTPHPTTLAPPARFRHGMAPDAVHGRVLLFGGCPTGSDDLCPTALGDTWLFDGTWRELAGPGPTPRIDAAMAYRSEGSIWLYGGRDATGAVLGDLWAWDPWAEGWSEQLPTAPWPGPRAGALLADHSGLNRGVLFGGVDPGGTLLDDTWHVPGFSLAFELQAVTPPPARSGGGLAYDPQLGRLWLFGGSGGGAGLFWYDAQGWHEAVAAVPFGARDLPAVTYDAARQELLVVGGHEAPGESWSFAGGAFALREAAPVAAASVLGATWDPLRGGVLVGADSGQYLVTATGSLPVAGAPGGLPVFDSWRGRALVVGAAGAFELAAGAPVPVPFTPGGSARPGAAVAFDPVRGETILFGGTDAACPSGFCAETWAFDGTTATQPTLRFSPPARRDAALAFDAGSGHLVLVGGEGLAAVRFADVWELRDDGWYQLLSPGPCQRPAAFGSPDGTFRLACSDDLGGVQLYRRSGIGFVAEPAATIPPMSAAAFDPARGLAVLAGQGLYGLAQRSPHARWPAVVARIELPEGTLTAVDLTAVAAGRSARPAGIGPEGAELHLWSRQAGAFELLASGEAALGGDAAARTITGTRSGGALPAGTTLFALVTTPAPSGDVAGSGATLEVDALFATVELSLP